MTEHPNAHPPTPNSHYRRDEQRWMMLVAMLTMLVTLLPYLIGWMGAQERVFMWLGYNLDDSCVYLSWMRQAADGSLRALNLFTTDSQKGMLLNPFYLVLGWITRLTHLPLIAVYHLARLACGAGLLIIVWEFLTTTVANPFARRLALLCVCFASGVGWIPFPWEAFPTAPTCPPGPIDLWQPEAITFLSLLLSPLFCVSLALQIGILLLLFKGEQAGRIRYALSAGLCGFILGLIHTYDILSVSAVWAVYLVVMIARCFRQGSGIQNQAQGITPEHIRKALLQAVVAGACTVPAVAYIYYQLQTEATFLKRANVVTGSALPIWVLLGYGLTLAIAVYGVLCASKKNTQAELNTEPEHVTDESPQTNTGQSLFAGMSALHLLIVWAVINVLISYVPVSRFPFQRKMLQGAHFPIAILAGCGLTLLLMQPSVRRSFRSVNFAAAIVLIVLSLSNLRFVARELTNYRDNRVQSGQRAYLNPGELEALQWIKANTPDDTAIQPLPWVARSGEKSLSMMDMTLACFVPSTIHRNVYCGHWGETPDYGNKLQKLIRFTRPDTPDQLRIDLLTEMRVQYLLFSQKHYQSNPDFPFYPMLSDPASIPPYLELVHSNADADVYKVKLSPQTAKMP